MRPLRLAPPLAACLFAAGLVSAATSSAATQMAALAPGSMAMTMTSAATMSNGLVQSQWQGGGITDTMDAPAGSTLSVVATTLPDGRPAKLVTVTPPQAQPSTPSTSSAGPTTTNDAVQAPAAASWTNPGLHTTFNQMTNEPCDAGECIYESSEQYAYNETQGDWIIGQKTEGTVIPATAGDACYGAFWTHFAGESGDSGPLPGYSPSSDTTSSSGSYDVSFDWDGYSPLESRSHAQHPCSVRTLQI